MGVVSWMVGTADGFLADAAESQFGAVASNTGTIVLLMVTLSLIGVCINMAFQFRSMDGASFFWYLVKLTMIGPVSYTHLDVYKRQAIPRRGTAPRLSSPSKLPRSPSSATIAPKCACASA